MFSPLISQLFWPGPVLVQLEFVLISLFILISVFILISGCGMTVCFIRYIGGRAVDQFINFIKIYFQFCHSKASKAIRKPSYHRHARIWFGAPRLQRLWHFWVEEMSLNQLEQAIPPSPRNQNSGHLLATTAKRLSYFWLNKTINMVTSGQVFLDSKSFFLPRIFISNLNFELRNKVGLGGNPPLLFGRKPCM